MAETIEDIEDAIITALDDLKDAIGVRIIKTYQGELDEADVNKLAILCPAVFVVYGGSTIKDYGARKVEHIKFHLFFCDRNLRAEEAARRGGTTNPGTYAMLNSTRDLLIGKRLGLDIYPIELIREASVWFARGISLYGAEYETAQALLYPAT
jgi:phage gp37-like protein